MAQTRNDYCALERKLSSSHDFDKKEKKKKKRRSNLDYNLLERPHLFSAGIDRRIFAYSCWFSSSMGPCCRSIGKAINVIQYYLRQH